MLKSISAWCAKVVSLGIPAHMPLGTLLGSLMAFPLIILGNVLVHYAPMALCWIIMGALCIAIVALLIASRLSAEQTPLFVIDKIIGLIFAFTCFFTIELNVKRALIGFVVFHGLRVLMPMNKYVRYLELFKLGATDNNSFYSVISGLIVNLVLGFSIWFAQ
jgi:hypothetical protein